MKKTLIGLGAIILVTGSISVASALTLTDTTYFGLGGTNPVEDYTGHGWGAVNKLDGFGDYVSWNHNFVFDPPASEIYSASLTLWFCDDERDKWYNPFTWEFGFGFAEDGSWDLGAIDTGTQSYDVNVAFLADGRFGVTVASLGGDFYLKKSELSIDYAPVPEPGTMLLMGVGLAGLAGYSRKRNKKS